MVIMWNCLSSAVTPSLHLSATGNSGSGKGCHHGFPKFDCDLAVAYGKQWSTSMYTRSHGSSMCTISDHESTWNTDYNCANCIKNSNNKMMHSLSLVNLLCHPTYTQFMPSLVNKVRVSHEKSGLGTSSMSPWVYDTLFHSQPTI